MLKGAGIAITGDVSVAVYDDLDVDALIDPPLVSGTTDYEQMARVAFQHLDRMIHKGTGAQDRYVIRLHTRLVTEGRRSAGPARQK